LEIWSAMLGMKTMKAAPNRHAEDRGDAADDEARR